MRGWGVRAGRTPRERRKNEQETSVKMISEERKEGERIGKRIKDGKEIKERDGRWGEIRKGGERGKELSAEQNLEL